MSKVYDISDAHRLLELAEAAALQAQQSMATDWERAKVHAQVATAFAQIAMGAAAVHGRG